MTSIFSEIVKTQRMDVLGVTLDLWNVIQMWSRLKRVNKVCFYLILFMFLVCICIVQRFVPREVTLFISAIIITGGDSSASASIRSVEILRENGSYWCSLPNLPDVRDQHTQSGLVTCGGYHSSTMTSCLTFSSGQWRTSHQLQHRRYFHSSWMSQHGVVLMGGLDSETTTEMLTEDGQSSPSFTLKHTTQ